MNCPCCGAQMKKERELDTTIIMKCVECGLSDTQVKS